MTFITVNLPLDADTDDALDVLASLATDADVSFADARIANANEYGNVVVAFETTRDDWTTYVDTYDLPDADDFIV